MDIMNEKMDFERIEIDLRKEEQDLLDEIVELQKKMKDADPAKMNGQLMSAIQAKSIETITMALGISDVLENTAHTNGLDYKKEYGEYQKWENTPIADRSSKYKPKYTTGNEFESLLKKEIPKFEREKYTEKGEGLSQKNTTSPKWRESKINGGVNCAYTGKFIKNGEPDKKKAYEWEHVKSAKEVHDDKVLSHVLSIEEKRNFLNSDENIVAVKGELNNDKRATKIEDIDKLLNSPSKKDPNKTVKEYHEIDEVKFKNAIKASDRKENEILSKKTIYKGAKDTTKIAASNAVKSAAKAAIGRLLSITVVEIINEYKREDDIEHSQRAKNISLRIKEKAKDLLTEFKDHSISSFLSTLIEQLLKSIFKIATNIFKFVKLAFVSILKAIKILFSSEYSWEVRLKEAMKILGVAVASLIGLALEEIIEKALITSLPFTAPFAGFISPVLSGLIVGIGSVLILQGFQMYQSKIVFNKLKGEETSKLQTRSEINLAQAGISDVKANKSVMVSLTIFQGTLPIIESCKNHIEESLGQIRKTKSLISENISAVTVINDENDELLNLLESN
ncbi:hypothetical protein [Marivirga sp.]|uniref:hypothetical protein n=1 Tax=Marivirga sp. TaxID=2018662 RepID=UPI0025EC11F9|nr:hypothetical protein [Marivirga sp.]